MKDLYTENYKTLMKETKEDKNSGFLLYPKVEHFCETFISCSDVKRRSNYLRTHLANGCTKQIKIKHRCSQTQFKAWWLDAEILSKVPREKVW